MLTNQLLKMRNEQLTELNSQNYISTQELFINIPFLYTPINLFALISKYINVIFQTSTSKSGETEEDFKTICK